MRGIENEVYLVLFGVSCLHFVDCMIPSGHNDFATFIGKIRNEMERLIIENKKRFADSF